MIIKDTDGREFYLNPDYIESVVHGPPHGGAITTSTNLLIIVDPDIAKGLIDWQRGTKTLAELAELSLVE